MISKINKNNFYNNLNKSIEAKKSLIKELKKIDKSIAVITKKIKKKGKLYICGNGGSAADAQHLAAEFLIRLKPNINRKPIPAQSLAFDTSSLTACGNDFSFDEIYARNLEAFASSKDILLVISTSGNSKNILNVLKTAKRKNIFCIGFLGKTGGKAKKLCNISILINSSEVARIQEAHIFLGHFICERIEENLI